MHRHRNARGSSGSQHVGSPFHVHGPHLGPTLTRVNEGRSVYKSLAPCHVCGELVVRMPHIPPDDGTAVLL